MIVSAALWDPLLATWQTPAPRQRLVRINTSIPVGLGLESEPVIAGSELPWQCRPSLEPVLHHDV